ncbi:MAG: lipoprotein signal peptidase [Chitinophagia bacterium]|jgi:signal peptidase II|nr:lipoprotein signal peptidase [Chitinophagia bacterium]
MKKSQLFFLILFILVADQALKIWIKTTYPTGEVFRVFGFNWFRIHFIENAGMAWGWQWGNETGKVILTLFRLAAVVGGTWYLLKLIREKYSKGFLICAGLIYAGAAGNLIDSMFYGMLFDKGLHFSPVLNEYVGYLGVAELSGKGYGSFLHGSVVDMLYFPIINGLLPEWVPFFGGQPFEFFSPIFNLADASISIGVITLLLFQKRLLEKSDNTPSATGVTNRTVSDTTEIM